MLDRRDAQDGLNGHDVPRRDAASDLPLAERPVADREVPLPGTPDGAALALHQWLDGDMSEAEARRVDAKQVDLWAQIATETDRRRRMTTPSYVADRIMAALPDTQTEARLATNTVRATVAEPTVTNGFSMTMVLAIGAGFFALGLLVANVFMR